MLQTFGIPAPCVAIIVTAFSAIDGALKLARGVYCLTCRWRISSWLIVEPAYSRI